MLARGLGGESLWCAACIRLRGVPGHEVLSTYRVQLRAEFDFAAAAAVADYLSALGVSHLYCSPYLQAAAGSAHGYDVVDPTRVSEELGGEPGHERLCLALAEHGLGQVLDIVPNHMAITGRRRPLQGGRPHGRFPVALLSREAAGEGRPDAGSGWRQADAAG